MPTECLLPEQGQIVHARFRPWITTQIYQSTLPPLSAMRTPFARPQHLVTLSSLEDEGIGEELQIVWENEPGKKVIEQVQLPEPDGFDTPDTMDAFLDAVKWGAASQADKKNIQAPFRSGIEIEDYQLDPVVRAIKMPRVSLLIADDVGLGKTIEAGMVALELVLRHRVQKIVIVCPSALQIQWKEQMRDKFGLNFRIVDSQLMRELRRSRGLHTNPWHNYPRLITSIDYLKRERPMELFQQTLPKDNEPKYPRRYDLLIVDEAHNCAPSSVGQFATDSLRTKTLRTLVPHFEHKLFLTATPHNGYPESFAALLNLLDNQRFSGGKPSRKQLEQVMIRRLKSDTDFAIDHLGNHRFPPRILEPIEVQYTDKERNIHDLLRQYTKLRTSGDLSPFERTAMEFVLKTLKKRLFSSPAAFLTTLQQHENSLKNARKQNKPDKQTLEQELERLDEDYADDEEYDDAIADAVDTATRLFRETTSEEKALLTQMKNWATQAKSQHDSKVNHLLQWIKENIQNGERVIIFTEYRATQNWLQHILASEGFKNGEKLCTIYGGMDSDKREEVKAAFQAAYHPQTNPVNILLATDAASEGLDFQNHCSRLIHYEIPWNPNRMEQRNGRVDRHGQKADRVMIYHFVGNGYRNRENTNFTGKVSDLEADLEFLMRVVKKIETIREDLGSVSSVIAMQVEEAMFGKRTTLDTTNTENKSEPVRKMLKFERDLKKQIHELVNQYHETQQKFRLTPENIEHVVNVGLKTASQPALQPMKTKAGKKCFRVPAMKGSWALCSEGLKHPHTNEERPITFDESVSRGRDDIVLAHLRHRLPEMCLRLLRAEIWAPKSHAKLQRVTARIVPDRFLNEPAVIAHARLVLVGGDQTRLHEEVIAAGGYIRNKKWGERFKTVGEMEKLLEAATLNEPSEKIKQSLLAIYPALLEPLIKALEYRKGLKIESLQKALTESAEKEAQDIEANLNELKRSIEIELKEPEYKELQKLLPGFNDEEKRQFEFNRDMMLNRINEIPAEIGREKEIIRKRYETVKPLLFPIAVSFYVPEKYNQ